MSDDRTIKITEDKLKNSESDDGVFGYKKKSKLMQKVQQHSKKIEDKFRKKYNASNQSKEDSNILEKKEQSKNSENDYNKSIDAQVDGFDDHADIGANQASYDYTVSTIPLIQIQSNRGGRESSCWKHSQNDDGRDLF